MTRQRDGAPTGSGHQDLVLVTAAVGVGADHVLDPNLHGLTLDPNLGLHHAGHGLDPDTPVGAAADGESTQVGVEAAGAAGYTIDRYNKVDGTISDDFRRGAANATIFSLIVIFLYIFVRFRKWQYGLGALVAMIHDVLIVLSLFSIFWGILPFTMEIDQAFIAAILTVIGYSINDTVVVFDRIREYFGLYGTRKDRKEVFNLALNSTLSRTINTSLSTFVVLLTIFLFGGDNIKGFVFALMVGVVVGTYSSIFIATPTVVDLSKDTAKA